MITTPELILFLSVAIVGYAIAFLCIARVVVVARSLQSGVPFVSSMQKYVEGAADLLAPRKGELIVDLGSGSGTFLIEAAIKYPEANFVGVEINRGLVLWTRLIVALRRVQNVKVIHGDVLDHDLSDYDKVYLYMTTDFLEKLMPLLEEQLRDGAVVLSNCFRFGKDFESRHQIEEHMIEGEKDKIFIWRKDE